MATDYKEHAASLHERARSTHAKWIASLTPEQRRNLAKLGVLAPPDDSPEVGGHSPTQLADIADSPIARIDIDFAARIDTEADELAEKLDLSAHQAREVAAWHQRGVETAIRTREADLLAVVIGGLLASNNIRIAAAGLAFATGMDAASGLGSEAEYARKLGVSRSILSKATKAWQRHFNLRTSAYQKSEAACATYSEVGRKNHWRAAKVSASRLLQRINAIRKTKNT